MAQDERQLLALLDQKKVSYKMVFIDKDDDAKQRMLEAGIKRLPQLHAGGRFIGDAAQVKMLDQDRELDCSLGLGGGKNAAGKEPEDRGRYREKVGGLGEGRDKEDSKRRQQHEDSKRGQQPRVAQAKPIQAKPYEDPLYEDPLASPAGAGRRVRELNSKKEADEGEAVQAFSISDSDDDSDRDSGSKSNGAGGNGNVVTVGGRGNAVTVMSGARGRVANFSKQKDSDDSDSSSDSGDNKPKRNNNIVSSGVMSSKPRSSLVTSGVMSNKPSRNIVTSSIASGLMTKISDTDNNTDNNNDNNSNVLRGGHLDNEKMLAASLGSGFGGLSSVSGLGAYKPKPRAVNHKPGHAKALAAMGLSSDSDSDDGADGRLQKVKSSFGGNDIEDFNSDDERDGNTKGKTRGKQEGFGQNKNSSLTKSPLRTDFGAGKSRIGGGGGGALGGLGLSPSMFGGTPEAMRSTLKAPLENSLKPLGELDSLVFIDEKKDEKSTAAKINGSTGGGSGASQGGSGALQSMDDMEDIEDMSMDEGMEFFSVTSKPHPAANKPIVNKLSPVQPVAARGGINTSPSVPAGGTSRLPNRRGVGVSSGASPKKMMMTDSDEDSESDMELGGSTNHNQQKRSTDNNGGLTHGLGGLMLGRSGKLGSTGGSVESRFVQSSSSDKLGARSTDDVGADDSWIFQDDWANGDDEKPSPNSIKPQQSKPIDPPPTPPPAPHRSLTVQGSSSSSGSPNATARLGGGPLGGGQPTPPHSSAMLSPSIPPSPVLSAGKPPPHRRPSQAVGASSGDLDDMEDIEDMSMDEGMEFFSVTSKPHPAANKPAATMIAPVQPATFMASKRDGGRNSFSGGLGGTAAAVPPPARALQASAAGGSEPPPSPLPTPPTAPPSAANKAIASFVTESSSFPPLGQNSEPNEELEEMQTEVTELRAGMQLLQDENMRLKEEKGEWKRIAEAREEDLRVEKERADKAEAAAATLQEVPVVDGGDARRERARAEETEARANSLQEQLDEAQNDAQLAAQAGRAVGQGNVEANNDLIRELAGLRSQLRSAEEGRAMEQRGAADARRELEAVKGTKTKAEAEAQREMVRLSQEREEGRKALVHEERRNREISTRLERAKEEKHDRELSSQKQMTETLEQLHQAQANERRLGQRWVVVLGIVLPCLLPCPLFQLRSLTHHPSLSSHSPLNRLSSQGSESRGRAAGS
jgi:hypothetical protein